MPGGRRSPSQGWRKGAKSSPRDKMTSKRRKTQTVKVRGVNIGSEHPVVVQSMTNTPTEDAEATARQVKELWDAGSELVRITVNTPEAASKVEEIRKRLDDMGADVPLVGDFHFNGDRLLKEFPACARVLDKYRINPGNVAKGGKGDDKFRFMIETAIENGKAVRIGVNWGSLDKVLASRMMDENRNLPEPLDLDEVMRRALVRSALENAQRAREIGLGADKIILSCKVSRVSDLVKVYRDVAAQCDYPLHLGLTEAGMGSKGIVASAAALGILLDEGIGDTIRISLTPMPGEARTKEVKVCQELLQSMGLRNFAPMVTSCPGCGRTTSTFFQELAQRIEEHLALKMREWRGNYPGVENMDVAVMGCVVNGPGESQLADIGISLPGTGESPTAPVYVAGSHFTTLKGEGMADEFIDIVEKYVKVAFGDGKDLEDPELAAFRNELMEKSSKAAKGIIRIKRA